MDRLTVRDLDVATKSTESTGLPRMQPKPSSQKSYKLEDIIKAVHREKGEAVILIQKGEVTAIYSKTDTAL